MGSNSLSSADLDTVLTSARSCAGAATMQELAERVVSALADLVASEVASYDEVDLAGGRSWGYTTPAGLVPPDATHVLSTYGRENPLIRQAVEHPDDTPRSWSELEEPSRMRRSNIYNLLYRRIGLEDHLAATLPSGSATVAVGAVVGRSRSGFSDRDRLVMDLFRRQLGPLRHLIGTCDRLRSAVGASPLVALGVDPAGVVRSVTGDLPAVTGAPVVASIGSPLADPVNRWWQEARRQPGERHGAHGDLWYRLVPAGAEDLLVFGRITPEIPTGGWQVGLMGGFRLTGPHGPVPLTGRPCELVKLLALAPGTVPADEVIERLWPEVPPDVGRQRLRVVLHRVPREPQPIVTRAGDGLALSDGVSVDARTFDEMALAAMGAHRRGDPSAAGIAETALTFYRADLLPEDSYCDWAMAPRERLRRLRLELLDVLAGYAEGRGDVDSAASLLGQAIDADPVEEWRLVRLGWLLIGAGRPAAAAAVVRRAEEVAADLGLGPSPELVALQAATRP